MNSEIAGYLVENIPLSWICPHASESQKALGTKHE